jgi:Glycine-zipper domain
MRTLQYSSSLRSYAKLPLAMALGFTLLLLAACAQMPTGPSVAVMPAPNKPFDIFMQDDVLCRDWAAHSIGIPGHDAAATQLLSSAVVGAAIGALAGAATGGDHRNVGAGAAIGTLFGATVGANQSFGTAYNSQRRYDIAYQQCMYSKGNLIPNAGYGNYRYVAPPPQPPTPIPQK